MKQRTGCIKYIKKGLMWIFLFLKMTRFASIVLVVKLTQGTKQEKFAGLRERCFLIRTLTLIIGAR